MPTVIDSDGDKRYERTDQELTELLNRCKVAALESIKATNLDTDEAGLMKALLKAIASVHSVNVSERSELEAKHPGEWVDQPVDANECVASVCWWHYENVQVVFHLDELEIPCLAAMPWLAFAKVLSVCDRHMDFEVALDSFRDGDTTLENASSASALIAQLDKSDAEA